jgi:hypothetical protein
LQEIKRGYVIWTDKDGPHKEPLYLHPELEATASEKQLAASERLKALNAVAKLDQQLDLTLEARPEKKPLKV